MTHVPFFFDTRAAALPSPRKHYLPTFLCVEQTAGTGAEPPPSPVPKGAVNRRRRCSVSAEVDASKVSVTAAAETLAASSLAVTATASATAAGEVTPDTNSVNSHAKPRKKNQPQPPTARIVSSAKPSNSRVS